MRLNQFIARATGMSRRQADSVISDGRVSINGVSASIGVIVNNTDVVMLDGQPLNQVTKITTILLNKPVGYVCSRNGQGSRTVYDLLPSDLHDLKPVGRLDKDSSGLLLLTNDGDLANQLTHPSFEKEKVYNIALNRDLTPEDKEQIEAGVELEDGKSHLKLSGSDREWTVTMSEGRNRQIRRTFAALGYNVVVLHRIMFGQYRLGEITPGKYETLQ